MRNPLPVSPPWMSAAAGREPQARQGTDPQGPPVSALTAGQPLQEVRLQPHAVAGPLWARQRPDRDSGPRSINEPDARHRAAREPVVSADVQKQESLRQLPGPGRQATDGAAGIIPAQRLSWAWRTSLAG